MPNKLNVSMLEKAQDSLANSKGLFVIDYRGLTVKETQGLRRALSEAGAHMKVYKNNIVKIALEKANLPEIQNLEGTCAYAPCRVLLLFAQVLHAVSLPLSTLLPSKKMLPNSCQHLSHVLAYAHLFT